MVTTPSGSYTYDEIMLIERELGEKFKWFWKGIISGEELERAKKDSGLSSGEIASVQYTASMQVAKEKEEI